ncbi:MAG: hypothetical protein ACHQPH_20930 [Reyranellales bacterium]
MNSPEPAARSEGPPVGTILLLILAGILYAAMMGSLSDVSHTDAAGRGIATAFGALFATVLLIVLAILLVVAAVKGQMSLAGRIGSFVVVPATTVAIWMAADALGNRDRSAIWVPALMPPLIALYALRARFAPLRALMNGVVADIAMAVAIVGLVGVPLQRTLFPPPPDPVAEARAAEEEKARLDREEQAAREAREREAAQFAALGPDSAMADYMPFLYGTYSREAHEGIRTLKTRQADAVALLNDGRLSDLAELLLFDVDATADLCAAYGAALARDTAKVDPKAGSNQLGVAIDLERQLPNLQWLTGEGCDLNAPLIQLEKNLRAVADSSRITKFADELAKLRSR